MAFIHARTQVWLDDETGEPAHVTHHHYNPALVDGSDYAKGASAHEMRASIDEVARGLRAPDVHDLEMISSLVASLHLEHFHASVRLAKKEQLSEALDVLHEETKATIAAGTGASLDVIHDRAMKLTTHIARKVDHIKRMTDLHTKKYQADEFAAVAAEVAAHRATEVSALRAAIAVELADVRAQHADLSVTIGEAIANLPTEVRDAVLAKRADLKVHVDAHAANVSSK